MINYSFIIPHHNNPDLLNRCLDSIPEREDIQVIVVDDNSAEDSKPKIIRNDVEIVYIDSEHTKGAGHARNVGLSIARGKWLLFADCDDYYAKGFISVLDRYIDDDIEVLYFNFSHVDGITDELLAENKHQHIISYYDDSKEFSDYIRLRNNPPWTKMVLRDFVIKNKMYFEEVPNGNDSLFSLFVGLCVKRFKVEKTSLYVYVKNGGSLGTQKQSHNDILCRINHCVKHNYLNAFIGHNDWNTPLYKKVFEYVRSEECDKRFSLLFYIFIHIPSMLKNRGEWVDILVHKEFLPTVFMD